MFELIGLVFDTLILLVLAAVTGCIFAFAGWLIVRQRNCQRWLWISIAFAIPVASAAYLWICVALLPGESLFGDFSEKLPNGYVLTGLGKMPDYSYIEKEGSTYGSQPTPGCIERLQVVAQFVAGQYGQRCRSTAPGAQPQEKFFIFDTKSGSLQNLETLAQAATSLGQPTRFVDSQDFKSDEPSARWQRRIDAATILIPPILVALLYGIKAFRLPRGDLRQVSILDAT